MFDLPALQERLSRAISPARYRHSLAVMELARELAAAYGADPEEAAVAGLLHDVAREMEPGRLAGVGGRMGVNPFRSGQESADSSPRNGRGRTLTA